MMNEPRLLRQVEQHPYPLLFATISGAHLYGFPSPDSDFDLRGVHLLPLEDVVGLKTGQETVEKSGIHDGLEIDLVTHDARKFFGLLLKKNGYVLEQVLSPLVVHTTPEHAELKEIAQNCITRHHAHHYLGFVETQWKLFQKENPPHVKPLLYVYRVLLTGIHLMRTGEVQANLGRLNESFKLSYIPELIERKVSGTEKGRLEQADLGFHQREYERLRAELEQAYQESKLPEAASGAAALHDLLVRLRLGSLRTCHEPGEIISLRVGLPWRLDVRKDGSASVRYQGWGIDVEADAAPGTFMNLEHLASCLTELSTPKWPGEESLIVIVHGQGQSICETRVLRNAQVVTRLFRMAIEASQVNEQLISHLFQERWPYC
jgi:predicted nucleotidyltransferase